MTCPKCHSEFETMGGVCPQCGVSVLRNVSGVMKTSVVMIAAGEERGFYHSVQDVPEPLRRQLLETTVSGNSGTIVIADRAGKEQLTQAMARRESTREDQFRTSLPADPPETPHERQLPRFHPLAWAGFVLALGLAVVLAALFYHHW